MSCSCTVYEVKGGQVIGPDFEAIASSLKEELRAESKVGTSHYDVGGEMTFESSNPDTRQLFVKCLRFVLTSAIENAQISENIISNRGHQVVADMVKQDGASRQVALALRDAFVSRKPSKYASTLSSKGRAFYKLMSSMYDLDKFGKLLLPRY